MGDVVIRAGETPSFDDLGDFDSVNSQIDSPEATNGKEQVEDKQNSSKDEQKHATKEEAFDEERGETLNRDGKSIEKKPGEKDSKAGEKPGEKGEKNDKDDKESKDGDKKEEKEGEQDQSGRGRPKEIKGKVGDEPLKIRADAKFQVSVDGEKQELSLQELINNSSSRLNINKQLDTIKAEKGQIEKVKNQFEQERDVVKNYMSEVVKRVDGDNPLDALHYLLEISGKDAYTYTNKVFKHLYDEFEQLNDMDDVEREAYFLKKENEYLKKSNQARESMARQQEERKNFSAQVNKLRQQFDISEEEYANAYKELETLGHKEIKPEQVVDYQVKLNAINKAESLIQEAIPSKIDDDELVTLIAKTLVSDRGFAELGRAEIVKILKEEFGEQSGDDLDEDLQQLAKKAPPKQHPEQPQRRYDEDHVETFDDFI